MIKRVRDFYKLFWFVFWFFDFYFRSESAPSRTGKNHQEKLSNKKCGWDYCFLKCKWCFPRMEELGWTRRVSCVTVTEQRWWPRNCWPAVIHNLTNEFWSIYQRGVFWLLQPFHVNSHITCTGSGYLISSMKINAALHNMKAINTNSRLKHTILVSVFCWTIINIKILHLYAWVLTNSEKSRLKMLTSIALQ